MIVSGGRARLPLIKTEYGSSWILAGNNGRLYEMEPYEDYDENSFVHRLAAIFGTVEATVKYDATGNYPIYTCLGHTAESTVDGVTINVEDIFADCGWVEGSVVDDTASLPWCGLVRNGRLYVCIGDYDETAGDNRVYNKISLDVTDGAPSFDTLLTNPSRYLVGETTRGNWSTVENYLHQHCPLEVVGLVVSGGVITGHTYIDFPGIAYGVNV